MAALDQVGALFGGRKFTAPELERLIQELDAEAIEAMLAPIQADEDFLRFNKYRLFFPDETVEIAGQTFHARHLYSKHVEFFEAGARYRERCFLAGNRTGKTIAGAFEVSGHLTGLYPEWWTGYRFHKPVRAWAAGDTNETTRDIIQLELMGNVIGLPDGRKGVDGAGMIPRECIGPVKWKQGVADLIDTAMIKHESGGWSMLGFKSFDQGRRSFQGTAKEVIWLDEECPEDVYGECLVRTATTKGRLLTTFTPLKGLSPLVLGFLPDSLRPGA
jgi:phage terminase large subunit-like protein